MPEIKIKVPKKEVQLSEILGTIDYSLDETVEIEDEFSITYKGEPHKKDLGSTELITHLSLNFNIELTDFVSEYIAYKIGDSDIKIGNKDIENPTKEKIDEAFREALEDR